jgi:HlyD family secretion protein
MALKKKRRIPWAGIVVGLAVAGGGGYWVYQWRFAPKTAELPPGVQVGAVQRGDLTQKITASGIVAAQIGAKVAIGAQVTGRVRSLPADVGERVAANQVVAEVDSPELRAQVQQQQENVRFQEASLAQAESRLLQARLNATLSEDQTRAEIREANFALRAARERLSMSQASAQLQPTQTQSEIERAEAVLNTARSAERQVRATVAMQLLQAQTSTDDAQAAVDSARANLARQKRLIEQGFTSRQELEDASTALRQATARVKSAQANQGIVKEKTDADLQSASDQVKQADAALRAARAGQFQDRMREAEVRSARETAHQAEASLSLRRTSLTQDKVRRRAVQEAEQAVKQASAGLKQANAQLEYQQAQLAKAIIYSPIAGTVLTIAVQQGETITAGFQTPTLLTVADLSRLEVRAFVDEVDIGRVRLGLPSEVRVEAFPDHVFRGRVTKIASASTVKDNIVTYETTIAVDNRQGLLRPDMTTDVTLLLGRRANVLNIPSEAVHREMDRVIAYVLHRDKQDKERVETRTIKVGSDDGTHTEVTSGLKQGEEVILAGLQRLGVKAVDSQLNPATKKDKEEQK